MPVRDTRPNSSGSSADGPALDPPRRVVVVAGVRHSGASAVARLLAALGLRLPETAMGPTADNEPGGESAVLHALHEELLTAAGSTWDDVSPFPGAWQRSPSADAFRTRLVAALEAEYPGAEPFIIQAPHVCRLIPFWLTVLDEFGVSPSFVIPVRNPLDVATSLASRDELSPSKGILLWLRHVLDGERDTRGHPRAFVEHQQLLRDWRGSMDAISERIGLRWPRDGDPVEAEVARYLSPDERHHNYSLDELATRGEVAGWVKETHALLLEACTSGEPDSGRLDELGAALAEADLTYGPLLAEKELEARERERRLTSELEHQQERAAKLELRIEQLQEREQMLERARKAEEAAARRRDAATYAELKELRGQAERAREAVRELRDARPARRVRPASRSRPALGKRKSRSAFQLASWLLNPRSQGRPRNVREFMALRRSPLFDRAFYLRRNPDVASAGMNPVMHYIEHGARALLDPSPSFSTRAYLTEHPELVDAGINPLYHFQRSGGNSAPRDSTGGSTPRIGYVIWDYPALSQTFVLSEIELLIERGYDVHVYHRTEPDRRAQTEPDVPSFTVKDENDLARLVSDHERTVLHSHFVYPAVTRLTWPAAVSAGIPFTFMVHGVDIFHQANAARNRVAEISRDDRCLRVFGAGEHHRRTLIDLGVPPAKVAVARQASSHPLASREIIERRLARPRRVVTCIARFVEKKGIEDLIRAAAILRDRLEVRIYGFGPLEQAYRSLAAETGATEVVIHEPLENSAAVDRALEEADLFALPCVIDANGDMDGLPTAIGEAMAAGVPVVTTNVSSIPEIVEDGVTGFVVPPGDPDALASKLAEVAEMPSADLRRTVQEAQRVVSEDWSVEAIVDTLLETWTGRSVGAAAGNGSRAAVIDDSRAAEVG